MGLREKLKRKTVKLKLDGLEVNVMPLSSSEFTLLMAVKDREESDEHKRIYEQALICAYALRDDDGSQPYDPHSEADIQEIIDNLSFSDCSVISNLAIKLHRAEDAKKN